MNLKNEVSPKDTASKIMENLYWFFHVRNLTKDWQPGWVPFEQQGKNDDSVSFVARPIGWPNSSYVVLRISPQSINTADISITTSHVKLDESILEGAALQWSKERGFSGKNDMGKRLVAWVDA